MKTTPQQCWRIQTLGESEIIGGQSNTQLLSFLHVQYTSISVRRHSSAQDNSAINYCSMVHCVRLQNCSSISVQWRAPLLYLSHTSITRKHSVVVALTSAIIYIMCMAVKFYLWPWPSNLIVSTWASCQISRLKAVSVFVRTHTGQTDCITWTTNYVGR